MENHPIPQDVTGFQFKLIGSMTVKQFAYILIGVILAIILYYLPLSGGLGFIIKTFFIPLFGAGGLILAFVPIEGRPIDIMLANFIKALFAPNQFVYQKTGQRFSAPPQSPTPPPTTRDPVQQIQPPIQQQKTQSASPPQPIVTVQQTVATTAAQPPAQQIPIEQTATKLAAQEASLAKQLNEAKKFLTPQEMLQASSVATQKVSALERQVNELHFQRQQLEQQLQHLQNQLDAQKQPTTPTAATTPPASPQMTQGGQTIQPPPASPATTQGGQPPVRTVPAVTQKTGLPHVPDTANVIAGIVKDPRGNVLPNMLVEVKDIQGNPVRAFKTNALGQFASATPLAPGEYTVELEDPKKQNTFDIIQLHATNQILLPIEIISHDAREELRKQLFN